MRFTRLLTWKQVVATFGVVAFGALVAVLAAEQPWNRGFGEGKTRRVPTFRRTNASVPPVPAG